MMKIAAATILYVIAGVASGASSASPVLSTVSDTARFSWEIPQGGLGTDVSFYTLSPAGTAVFVVTAAGASLVFGNYAGRLVYQGNIAARNVTFTLSNIQTSDAGTYTCGNGGATSVIQNCGQKLVVLGKPTTPGRPVSTTPVYNQQVTLTCSSTSTTVPSDHGLTLTYTWQRDNTNITVTSPGSSYTYTVSSRDSHSYRCRARESQGLESEWSQGYNMEPQYGPYAVTLQPSTLSYTRREGQESVPSILCSATCRPACTSYKWFKGGTVHSDGATLTLPVADRSQTGSYKCQASNTHGTNDSSSVSVDITHRASISMLTANSRNGSVTVNESDVVILRCQLDNAGKPRSVIRLLNGTEELTKADNSLTAEYRLESAECRQRGNYSCTVSNNIGTPVSQWVELRVKCSPRLAVTVPTQLKYAATLGGNVNVSVSVLAYPFPTFTWSRTNCTSQDLIGSSSPVSDISVTARLHLTDLQQQDVGDYSLTVGNGVGSSVTYTLTIVAVDPPDQRKLETPCLYSGVIVGSTVGGILLTLLIVGSVHMVLYRKGYKFGHIPEETASRKSTRNSETVEMDNRGYSSLDQINGPVQYSNLEESEKQQYSQLKIYENTKADAAADTSTYEGTVDTPPVTYESVRVSPYQNTEAHSQGNQHMKHSYNSLYFRNESTMTGKIIEYYKGARTIYVWGILLNGVASQLSSSPVVVRESQTASFRWQVPAVTGGSVPVALYVISPSGAQVLLVNTNTNNHLTLGNYTARVTYTGDLASDPKVMTFDLRSVVRSDAGDFICGSNGIADIIPQCGQKLVVPGQPTKPTLIGQSAPLFERQFTLTCSSTSTTVPADHGLTLTNTWRRDNADITVTSPGSPYTFTVSSRDSHSYRCKATEGQGLESEWSQLYNMEPQYGPYAVTLQPTSLSYTRREGQESVPSILCSATCRPACTYKWFKDGTVHSDGATLTLPVADRSQTGSYKCQASNTHGTNDSSSVSVDVTHQASISMLTANSRNGSVTVNESDVVILRCQLDNAGKPRSVIRLLNGTEELTRADNSLTAEYRLESADCRQRGNYSCTATNNIGEPVSQRVELRVKCSPRLAVTVPTQLKYAATLGGNVNVSVSVLAYPLPTFTWSRTNCTSQDLIGSSSPVSDISVTARLQLTNIQQQDFGDYRLTVDNGVGGSVTYTLTIVSVDPLDQQKLETPCSCTVVIVGSTVGGILLTLLIGGSVHMVLYRKGYKFVNIPEEIASRKRIRNPETVEVDNRGYSSLDQINGPAQYSNLEESEKQQYSQLKIYDNTNADAAADTSTYEGMTDTPPVTYESVRVSPYQNTGAHSQGPDHGTK
ncbi:basement membrane-specific heparan sulfate proteoglycan core protein-like [Haliotis rufescens]|uniref:basement membrane-specific heparan sulfate proteoglycan core protein-like n=1 Tax=Haliotis rufescens TaxID=6454 RepID=UPI00201F5235|nr:basement membrane-specific heparan sulfate proteoglycan core protein-like [Haliotis rufescens]